MVGGVDGVVGGVVGGGACILDRHAANTFSHEGFVKIMANLHHWPSSAHTGNCILFICSQYDRCVRG